MNHLHGVPLTLWGVFGDLDISAKQPSHKADVNLLFECALSGFLDIQSKINMLRLNKNWFRVIRAFVLSSPAFNRECLEEFANWKLLPEVEHVVNTVALKFNPQKSLEFLQLLGSFDAATTDVGIQLQFHNVFCDFIGSFFLKAPPLCTPKGLSRVVANACLNQLRGQSSPDGSAQICKKYFSIEEIFRTLASSKIASLVETGRQAIGGQSSSSSDQRAVERPSKKRRREFEYIQLYSGRDAALPPVLGSDLYNLKEKGCNLSDILLFLFTAPGVVRPSELADESGAHVVWKLLNFVEIDISPELLYFLTQNCLLGLVTEHVSSILHKNAKSVIDDACMYQKWNKRQAYLLLFAYFALTSSFELQTFRVVTEYVTVESVYNKNRAEILKHAQKNPTRKRKMERTSQWVLAGMWQNISKCSMNVWLQRKLCSMVSKMFSTFVVVGGVTRITNLPIYMKIGRVGTSEAGDAPTCKGSHGRLQNGRLYFCLGTRRPDSCACEPCTDPSAVHPALQDFGKGPTFIQKEKTFFSPRESCTMPHLERALEKAGPSFLQAGKLVLYMMRTNKVLFTHGDVAEGHLATLFSGPCLPGKQAKKQRPVRKLPIPSSTFQVQFNLLLESVNSQQKVFLTLKSPDNDKTRLVTKKNGETVLRAFLRTLQPEHKQQVVDIRLWPQEVVSPHVQEIAYTLYQELNSAPISLKKRVLREYDLVLRYYTEKRLISALTGSGSQALILSMIPTATPSAVPYSLTPEPPGASSSAATMIYYEDEIALPFFIKSLQEFLRDHTLSKNDFIDCFAICMTLNVRPKIFSTSSWFSQKIQDWETACALDPHQKILDEDKYLLLRRRARNILNFVVNNNHDAEILGELFSKFIQFAMNMFQLKTSLCNSAAEAPKNLIPWPYKTKDCIKFLVNGMYEYDWMKAQM